MKVTLATLIASVAAVLGIGCERIEADGAYATLRQPIVYGTDDRIEAPGSPTNSVLVALIPRAELASAGDAGTVSSFAGRHSLCPGERFADQPAVANCTGVLLDSELLLTPAHCLEVVTSCHDYVYSPNYYAQGDAGVLDGDLGGRECESVLLVRHTSILEDQRLDFAVLQLSAAMTDITKPELRATPPVVGEPVTTVGTSGGLPFKSTAGAVLAVRAQGDYFDFTGDLFAGGSGSAVFDDQGSLLGMHVRGEPDFELTGEGCWRTRTVTEDGGAGSEQANTIASVLHELCELLPERTFCSGTAEDGNTSVPEAEPMFVGAEQHGAEGWSRPGPDLEMEAPSEKVAADAPVPRAKAEAEVELSTLPVADSRIDPPRAGCSIVRHAQSLDLRGLSVLSGLLCFGLCRSRARPSRSARRPH